MRRRALCLLFVFAPLAGAAAEPALEPGESAEVRAIEESGTVALADGRAVALVGIALPLGDARLLERAQAALERMLVGHSVELRYAGNRRDRYGRILAHLFQGESWVQGELLRRGLARVQSTADNRKGVAEMLALEDAARGARRGLWREHRFAVRAAAEAGRYAGSFQIVEGAVVDAVRFDGAVWLNFAADWRHGFTLHLAAPALRLFRADALNPTAFAGERLRARGFIYGSERPTIDITHPEQLEHLGR